MPYSHKFTPSSKSSQDSDEEPTNKSPERCDKEDNEVSSEVQPSSTTSCMFFIDRTGADLSEGEREVESSTTNKEGTDAENTKILYDKPPERIVKLNQTSVPRPSIEGLDLESYIQEQKIIAPPKYRKRKSAQQERPLAAAAGTLKVEKTDACTSLHPVESAAGHENQNNGEPTDQVEKESVRVCMVVPENGPILMQPMVYTPSNFFNHESIADLTQNSWEFLSVLENKGIPLFWEVLQHVGFRNGAVCDQSRLFRCVVSFNHIVGVCEASKPLQAKHGAAWNFLREFQKTIPSIGIDGRYGSFPDKFDDAILVKETAFHTLREKLREIFGEHVFHDVYTFAQNINGRTMFKCILWMAWTNFEASSSIDTSVAEQIAVKAAYEKLLREPCPMDRIHIGTEECSVGDNSFYRVVESQRLHYPDFPCMN